MAESLNADPQRSPCISCRLSVADKKRFDKLVNRTKKKPSEIMREAIVLYLQAQAK